MKKYKYITLNKKRSINGLIQWIPSEFIVNAEYSDELYDQLRSEYCSENFCVELHDFPYIEV